MHEARSKALGHISEDRRCDGLCVSGLGRDRYAPRVRMSNDHALIWRNVPSRCYPTVGPLDYERVELLELADPECQEIVNARLKPAGRHHLLKESPSPAAQCHLRADGESVCTFRVALELHLDILVFRQRADVVPVDEGLVVYVVHHQIQRAVTVEIAIGSAVGKRRRVQSPGGALVREGQITLVAETVVGKLCRAHRLRSEEHTSELQSRL